MTTYNQKCGDAWKLCKGLASYVRLPETADLQGAEREDYNVLVAQDFYNLWVAYNRRYTNKTMDEKLNEVLAEIENLFDI